MTTILEFPMDLKRRAEASVANFRFHAVVDWLELELNTLKATNFHTIQRRVGDALNSERKSWVEPLNEGPGGAATRFALRIQDPENFPRLHGVMEHLGFEFGLAAAPLLRAIEVAVDVYSKRSTRDELEAMVLRLKHTIVGDGEWLECGAITHRVDNVRRVRPDTTLLIKGTDLLWRIYLKDVDHNKTPIADPAEHRARVEVCLSGDNRPVVEFPELRGLRFETLSRWFRFRRLEAGDLLDSPPTTPAEVANQHRLRRAALCGHMELGRPPKRERRQYSRHTVADREMKRRVRYALRDLTRRWNAKKEGT